jgi:transcriptional regulator with XRE-family HTH domain
MDGFGSRLVKLREKKGLNQRQLAEILNITPTRLNYWEKDKREPDFFMFSKIVQVLNADANELLGLNQINNFHVSAVEKKLLNAYREHVEMQPAINKMLDIDCNNSVEQDIISEIKHDAKNFTINTK